MVLIFSDVSVISPYLVNKNKMITSWMCQIEIWGYSLFPWLRNNLVNYDLMTSYLTVWEEPELVTTKCFYEI